jgi:hypothetical protein
MGALRCNHERIAHQPGSPAQRVARRDLRVSMSHGVGMSLRAVGLMRRRRARSHETSSTRDRTATGSFGTSKSVL